MNRENPQRGDLVGDKPTQRHSVQRLNVSGCTLEVIMTSGLCLRYSLAPHESVITSSIVVCNDAARKWAV